MPHRVLSHTADTGIEATSSTLSGLLEEVLAGMFGLMADMEDSASRRWEELSVEAATPADLVVDTLSEALYVSEVRDLIPCAFRVGVTDQRRATVALGGVPMRSLPAAGPAVKAVTYHDLAVEERDDGWYARVYFDV
ncbi:MAG: archease [Actinomycetota bacterium]